MNELVTVHVETLREYLSDSDDPYWELINETSADETRETGVVTVDELVERLYQYSNDGIVFLFAPESRDPHEIGWDADLETVPTIKEPEHLGSYTLPSGGNDFLYISPTEVEVQEGLYMTLLRRTGDDLNVLD